MAQITWSLLPFHCGFTKALIFCHLARGRARLGTGPHGQLEWKWYGSGKLQCCFRTERRAKSLGAPLPDQPKRRNVKLRECMNLCQVNPSEKPGLQRLLFLIWIFFFFFCWKWRKPRHSYSADLFWSSLEGKWHGTGRQVTYPNRSSWLTPCSNPPLPTLQLPSLLWDWGWLILMSKSSSRKIIRLVTTLSTYIWCNNVDNS